MNSDLHHPGKAGIVPMTPRAGNGFTLIEVMMVVMVIGLLTAIAVPSYKKVRETVAEKEALQDLLLLHSVVDKLAWDTGRFPGVSYNKSPKRTYYTDGSTFPTHIMSLTTSNAGLCSTDGSFPNWKGPYISSNAIPVRDPWGSGYWFDPHHYKYRDGGNHCYAAVISSGPDRLSYNDDDLYEIIQTYY